MQIAEVSQMVHGLVRRLEDAVNKDAEQEVRGMALPVLDVVIEEAKKLLPDHPVVLRFADIMSPEAVEAGEPLRAFDVLLALEPLHVALRKRVPTAFVASPSARLEDRIRRSGMGF